MSVTPLQASPFKERCRACEAERFYQRQRGRFSVWQRHCRSSFILRWSDREPSPCLTNHPAACTSTSAFKSLPYGGSKRPPYTHHTSPHLPKNTSKKFFEKISKKGLQFIKSYAIITELSARQWYALLAQLDRASGYGPEGQGFESLRACQKPRSRKVSGFFCFLKIFRRGRRPRRPT